MLKSLGRGMAPAKSTVFTPAIIPGDTDFIVFVGQSNLTTTGGTSGSSPTPDALALKATTSSVSALTQEATLLPAFANAFVGVSERKLITMNFASSGAALLEAAESSTGHSWDKATGSHYGPAVSDINDALTWIAANTAHAVGRVYIVYLQGERESQNINGTTITGDLYEAALEALAANFNADITGGIDEFLNIRVGKHRDGTGESDWDEIRIAQERAANDSGLIRQISSIASTLDSGNFADGLHYNQTGKNAIGTDAGAKAASGANATTFTAPVNTVAPAISGTEEVGETLSCSTGTWTGRPTPTFTYQWQNEGVNISGATSASYLLDATDEGDTLTCEVTAANDSGAAMAETTATGAIAPESGGGGFVPTDIASLEIWLDGSDTATIAETSDVVSQWDDKSGNDNHAVAYSGSVLTNTNTMNGKNVVTFSGDAMSLDMSFLNSSNYTLVFVEKRSSLSVGLLCGGNNNSSGKNCFIGYNPAGSLTHGIWGGAISYSDASVSDLVDRISSIEFNNSSGRILRMNGTSVATTASTSGITDFTGGALGARGIGDGVYNYPGDIAEVFMFSSALTPTEWNNLGAYIEAKWGITWNMVT